MKAILISCLFLLMALSACNNGGREITSEMTKPAISEGTPPPIFTGTPEPLPTAHATGSTTIERFESDILETPTVQVAYERLSPSRIRIPDIDLTVELSGRLTQSVLDINTDISVPVGFLTVFPVNTEPSIIQEVKLSRLSFPLNYELYGGGGGSGVDNGIFMTGGTQSYRIKTPLTPGQKVQVTVLVTFSKYINVKIAIPLTIELIVEPTSIVPQG
ncbi:MAG: hypothetical protein WBV22_09180 [Anaerolineaceae bacterium]